MLDFESVILTIMDNFSKAVHLVVLAGPPGHHRISTQACSLIAWVAQGHCLGQRVPVLEGLLLSVRRLL